MEGQVKRILLVDDLNIDVMLTRLALETYTAGLEVVSAGDGEEAYDMLQTGRFDLLLLDIKMPRVDGFELMERLQSLPRAAPPVMVVSGSGLAADRARAKALGAIEYVQKAVDYSSFKEELKCALQRIGLV